MAENGKSYLEIASKEHIEALHDAIVDVLADIEKQHPDAAERYADNDCWIMLALQMKTFSLIRNEELKKVITDKTKEQ